MRSIFHSTWQSVKSFLSNPAYATWVQSVFLAGAAVAAFLTIKENHHDNAVNNVNQAVQRYYSGSPTLFSYTNDLFAAQSALVQEAKKKMPEYADSDRVKLFKNAQPMVLRKFEQDASLREKYVAVEPYFVSTVLCVNSGACDERTTIELLKDDILGFYNAVCAYTSGDQGSKKDSQLLISFLVKQAGIAVSPDNYFCPEEAEKLLNEQ